jgi:hypothetical protein
VNSMLRKWRVVAKRRKGVVQSRIGSRSGRKRVVGITILIGIGSLVVSNRVHKPNRTIIGDKKVDRQLIHPTKISTMATLMEYEIKKGGRIVSPIASLKVEAFCPGGLIAIHFSFKHFDEACAMNHSMRNPSARKAGKWPFVIMLVALACVATSAAATQVKLMTPSSGSGATGAGNSQVWLTVGQNFIGKTNPVGSETGAELGLWYLLRDTYIVSGVEDIPHTQNQLLRNFPNPFNPSTVVSYNLVAESDVRIDVFDLKGRRVDTLLDQHQSAGQHSLTYQPDNLASGTYFVVMHAGDFRATQRIMLVK